MNVPIQDFGGADYEVSIRLVEYGPGGQKFARRPSFSRLLNLSPEATSRRHDRHPPMRVTVLMLAGLLVLASVGFFTYSLMASPYDWEASKSHQVNQ